MKKIFLMAILLVSAIWFAKAQDQVVKYPEYTAYYNPLTKIPDSVVFIVKPHKKASDRESGFHSTGNRPDLLVDYRHSGYDIGHNADASDMNDNSSDEYDSFDFANTYPQRPNCNRITWLGLENYCRALATTVRVKTSWLKVQGYMGKDKVVIPLYCVKELWYGGKYEKYIIPNQDTCTRHPFTYYRVK